MGSDFASQIHVAAGVPPAVKGGILPPGARTGKRTAASSQASAGQDARLYGRRDVCRYNQGFGLHES